LEKVITELELDLLLLYFILTLSLFYHLFLKSLLVGNAQLNWGLIYFIIVFYRNMSVGSRLQHGHIERNLESFLKELFLEWLDAISKSSACLNQR